MNNRTHNTAEEYTRTQLKITEFDAEDVIITSMAKDDFEGDVPNSSNSSISW